MKIKPILAVNSDKTKQVIIAKYKENTSWVHRTFVNTPYIIYNKSDKRSPHYLPNIPYFPVQRFEGVKHQKTPTGRESHTYLYHIITHYNKLADMNIFLQGNPYEITSNALDPLQVVFKRDFKHIHFMPLNFPLVICDKRAAPLHTGLPLERVFKKLFQGTCPDFFAYSWGAMFCVTKEYIQKRPLCFYEQMMQIIYEEPLSGYVYERLWPTALGCHGFLCHPSYPTYDRSSWQLPGIY